MSEILLRSYDEELESFYYFFNGKYYADLEFKVEMRSEVFEWKNAQQFTGLIDKNGNKIFEGDVIEFKGILSGGSTSKGVVIWLQEKLRYEYSTYHGISNRLDTMITPTIIGNIHENGNK